MAEPVPKTPSPPSRAKASQIQELSRSPGGLEGARASWDTGLGRRALLLQQMWAPGKAAVPEPPGPFHTRHKWLPAVAAGKCQGRKAWQGRDFRRGWAAPHLTRGHGIFDRTITIAELIKRIWKGFRVGSGIGQEGPRNPLWGLKAVAKLQQKPYVVHISTFCFSLAPFSRPAPSRAVGLQGSGTTSHLEKSQDHDAKSTKPVLCLLLPVPCLFAPSQGEQHQV